MPAWLTFTLLRIGVFAGVFIVLLALRLDWLWAAVIAAVVGLCVSFIFFRGQRAAMAQQWATRAPRRGRDELAEDEVVDGAEAGAAPQPRPARSVREDSAES